jgi:SAM-dependent methyltransferase
MSLIRFLREMAGRAEPRKEASMDRETIASRQRAGKYADALFYHTIELPGEPAILGSWDLRRDTPGYLGNVPLSGKRVLELGAANGYLTFWMEKAGASVVPYDLSPELLGDIITYPGLNVPAFEREYRESVSGINRGWSYAREAFRSGTQLVHGSVYRLPEAIGEVDVSMFGCILLHLRDPYLALQQAARITRREIVVTDTLNSPFSRATNEPLMLFNPARDQDPCTWWFLSPEIVQRMLWTLGFVKSEVTFHQQIFRPGFRPWGATYAHEFKGVEAVGDLFTVVARHA